MADLNNVQSYVALSQSKSTTELNLDHLIWTIYSLSTIKLALYPVVSNHSPEAMITSLSL
jgi:hypothetical protein